MTTTEPGPTARPTQRTTMELREAEQRWRDALDAAMLPQDRERSGLGSVVRRLRERFTSSPGAGSGSRRGEKPHQGWLER